jgi:hypothetical protein
MDMAFDQARNCNLAVCFDDLGPRTDKILDVSHISYAASYDGDAAALDEPRVDVKDLGAAQDDVSRLTIKRNARAPFTPQDIWTGSIGHQ